MTLDPCRQLIQQTLDGKHMQQILKLSWNWYGWVFDIDMSSTTENLINCYQKQTWGSFSVSTSKAWKDATASFLRTLTRTLSISCSSLSFRFRNSRSLSFSLSWTEVERSWTNLHHSDQYKSPNSTHVIINYLEDRWIFQSLFQMPPLKIQACHT